MEGKSCGGRTARLRRPKSLLRRRQRRPRDCAQPPALQVRSSPASKFNRDCCPLKPPQTPLQYSLDFFQIPVHFSKIKLHDTNSPGPPRRAPNDGMRRIAHARGAGLISGLSISAADKIKEPRAGSAVRRRGHQIICFSRARKMRGNPREISAQKKPLRTFRKSFFGAFGGVFAAADSYSANAMSGSSASVILYWSPGRMTSGLSRAYTCK